MLTCTGQFVIYFVRAFHDDLSKKKLIFYVLSRFQLKNRTILESKKNIRIQCILFARRSHIYTIPVVYLICLHLPDFLETFARSETVNKLPPDNNNFYLIEFGTIREHNYRFATVKARMMDCGYIVSSLFRCQVRHDHLGILYVLTT